MRQVGQVFTIEKPKLFSGCFTTIWGGYHFCTT